MNSNDKVITLLMGDPSDDGHGKTATVVITSNLNKKEILAAYEKGTKKLGFNFISEVCIDYEDSSLPQDKLDLLIKHGMSSKDIAQWDDIASLWHDTFSEIFLFIVKLGNPEFQYKVSDDEEVPTIDIGGYGMFH